MKQPSAPLFAGAPAYGGQPVQGAVIQGAPAYGGQPVQKKDIRRKVRRRIGIDLFVICIL